MQLRGDRRLYHLAQALCRRVAAGEVDLSKFRYKGEFVDWNSPYEMEICAVMC